jgi:hypothetical protein
MKDKFEATLRVDLAPDAVWDAVARRDLKTPEMTRPTDAAAGTQVWLPGFDSTAEVLESVPGKLLRMRKDCQPCEGTEIAVRLEAEGSGTKITVVQSGFGAFFDIAANYLAVGWDHILRDLVLAIERGAIVHRHMGAWGPSAGFNFTESASGLVVTGVIPETLAAKMGMAEGDHLLTINSAPVATTRDLSLVMRALPAGSDVTFDWIRGRDTMAATAKL